MRSFPRAVTLRRTAPAVVLALVAVLGPLSGPGVSDDGDLKDRARAANRAVERAKADFDHSSKELAKATNRLQGAQQRLGAARAKLGRTQGRLSDARAKEERLADRLEEAQTRLSEARRDLAAARAEVEQQRLQLADTVTGYYQQGSPELVVLSSMMEAKTPADLVRKDELSRVLVDQEKGVFTDLDDARAAVQDRADQVADATDEVAQRQADAADHVSLLERLTDRARDERSTVAGLVDDRRDARSDAAKARAADRRKLRKARQQQAKLEQMLRKRAAAAKKRARANGTATGVQPGSGFLSYPAGSRITSPFGWRTHPIYGYRSFHDGIDLAPGCGVPITAAASGRVVSSYWSDVYGHRLTVDHGYQRGVGLATVYNHAERYTVGVGQHVDRGQVIGYVGNTGWSTGCHLHFSVMVNGGAVPPSNWL